MENFKDLGVWIWDPDPDPVLKNSWMRIQFVLRGSTRIRVVLRGWIRPVFGCGQYQIRDPCFGVISCSCVMGLAKLA